MMRFAFQVVVATIVFASASASLLPWWGSSRVIGSSTDIFGRYNNQIAVSSANCPRNVVHEVAELPQIPHSSITMNGNQCDGNGFMEELDSTDAAIEAINGGFAEAFINQVAEVEDQLITLFYFIERAGRACGNGPRNNLPEGALVVFVRTESNERIGSFQFRPTLRYMNIITPGGDQCLYTSQIVPISPQPTAPQASPSSSVVTVPAPPSLSPLGSVSPVAPSPPSSPPPMESVSPSMIVTPSASSVPDVPSIPDEEDEEDDEMEASMTPDQNDVDIANARASAEAAAAASPDDDDDGVCFPADASVELEDGSQIPISGLNVGDRVKVAPGVHSDVFMFTHRMSSVEHEFVTLTTSHGDVLSTTPGHYIYINNNVAAARTAKVGDNVIRGDGSISSIVRVHREIKTGLYNPQTVHGDIVVNNVRASTFTQTVDMITAQALLAPLRMFYRALGFSSSAFDQGADSIVPIMPKGELVV